ncbi:probable receptor-like protein kinase At1g33260 [Amborella trichopoda]|nr:probable receptor-like protein kinase At1g33260 [Amborella trichopoda]|eukprot:XP_020521985.1 probable receptor-like protein kinase At1g33260 [Amborella trichopoda]
MPPYTPHNNGFSLPISSIPFLCGCLLSFSPPHLSLSNFQETLLHQDHINSLWCISPTAHLLSVMACFACFRVRNKGKKNRGGERVAPKEEEEIAGEVVRRFSWREVEEMTKNFSCVIGEGGFSTVYLGFLCSDSLDHGAVKVHRNSERMNRVFRQELEVLMDVRHENIVKFLGYCDECDEKDEGALIFEYVPNGSLHDHLHTLSTPLPWQSRTSIALNLARAIEFIHDRCTKHIVHCDVKPSNVLLDQNLNPKLCDFGSARVGFSSTVLNTCEGRRAPVVGSPGYVDPHYLRTGIISKKNDVYSFGVLLLELITGIEAFCSEKGRLLAKISVDNLEDVKIVDERLKGNFEKEEFRVLGSICEACFREQPSLRPSMSEIVKIMEDNVSSSFNLECKIEKA